MKISVITISYNAIAGIEKTLASVAKQDYHDFEYIVVDGMSTDGTVEIIRKYQQHITRWVSEPDNGIYNAMNKGVRMAKGDYCIFMNAGDYFVNASVLSKVAPFLDGTYDYLAGNEVSVNKAWVVNYIKAPKRITQDFLGLKSISHQASFIRRELLLRCPYDETLRMVSDWKFCIQTLLKGDASYSSIPVDICKFNHDGISCTNTELGSKERKAVLLELLPQYLSYRPTNNFYTRFVCRVKKAAAILTYFLFPEK